LKDCAGANPGTKRLAARTASAVITRSIIAASWPPILQIQP
jgi:hypothetical protein